MLVLPKLICKFNIVPYKILKELFMELDRFKVQLKMKV